MGLFNKKPTVEEVRMANFNDISKITEFVTNGTVGVTLTEENVMQIPSVKNAVDMISNTVSSLPIYLYEEKDGKIKKVNNDERLFILNNEPNAFSTSSKLKKDLTRDILLYGKGYSYIDRKGVIKTNGLHFVNARHMQVTDLVNKKGLIVDKEYNFVLNNVSKKENFINVLEVNYGKGAIHEGRILLETLIHQNKYNDYVFKNAILPNGVLETEGRLTKEGAQGLKAQLERMYSGVNNFFRPLVLEQGLKWKTISQKPNDLMLDKAQAQANSDVEKLFNLPSGMLMMKNNIATNVSQENLLYLQRTVTPILVAIEEALNKSLLLESEKRKGYFFRFDTSELMKCTLAEMIELGVKANGGQAIMTTNEVRFMLDKEDIEDGDKIHLNLGGTGTSLGEDQDNQDSDVDIDEIQDIQDKEDVESTE